MPQFGLSLTETHALWNGHVIDLTATERLMLLILVRRAGVFVDLLELHEAHRGPNFAAGNGPEGYKTNVRSVIRHIRMKFRNVDPDFDEIKTKNSFGYAWGNPATIALLPIAQSAA